MSEIERKKWDKFRLRVDKLLVIMKDVDEEEFAEIIKEWRRIR
jgi:hypothetical protein